jgi:hypothetical protein
MSAAHQKGELIPASEAVRAFSEKYRTRTRRDQCGELVIPGKRGHVFEYGANRFGVILMLATKKRWNFLKRKLVAAGLQLKQEADTEGALIFDPANDAQVRIALEVIHVRFRRSLSPAQWAHLDKLNRRSDLENGPLRGFVEVNNAA